MAETELDIASRIQKWDSDFFMEYVRDNLFRPYMGRHDGNALMPILANYELTSSGKTVNIPLIAKLDGQSGVRGNARLTGREAAMGNYNHPIKINWNRNGVTIKKPEEHWTEMDLRRAAKTNLKSWASEGLRDDIICAMMSCDGGSILKGRDPDDWSLDAQTPAEFFAGFDANARNAWLVANSDRVLFGRAKANSVSGIHATALATIDNDASTGDRMTTAVGSLAKEMARETALGPAAIRPFKVDNDQGREWFVMFTNSRAFRDLKRDEAMIAANRDARPREVASNPLFQDGDLVYDGIIYREIPEIPVVPNGSIDCAPNFLCGAQAVGVAWGQEPKSATKSEDDYGFEFGVSIAEARATSKFTFNGKQHGMVTVWTAAVASA